MDLRSKIASSVARAIGSGNNGHQVWSVEFKFSKGLKTRWTGGYTRIVAGVDPNLREFYYDPISVIGYLLRVIEKHFEQTTIENSCSFVVGMRSSDSSSGMLTITFKDGLEYSAVFRNISEKYD